MTLSDKITTLRKQKGLSQENLAEKLNVSRQAVSRWEMGSAMPDAANILGLSKLFGVTTDYLLYDDYESDNDIPKVREITEDNSRLILCYLVVLEVMILGIQFMTVVLLDSASLGLFCCIPFLAAVGGFEYSYRKGDAKQKERSRPFRKRFYKISAWLGLYFPVRLFVYAVAGLWGRSFPIAAWECVILILYVGAALCVNLSIEKAYIEEI